MKNFLFGLIATIFFTSLSFGQKCDIKTSGQNPKWEKNDPALVAKLHNEYLVSAMNISMENPKLSDKDVLMKIDIPTISKETQSCIIDNVATTSLVDMNRVITGNFQNSKSVSIYNEIIATVEKSVNYQELQDKFAVLKGRVSTEIKEERDRDVLLTCIETGVASSYIWFSKEQGGSGIGYNFLQKRGDTPSLSRARTRTEKDLAGAGYGMVAWSFSAFLGPVGAAGLVYGAVTGALTSSFLP